jgi:hypothetical protein
LLGWIVAWFVHPREVSTRFHNLIDAVGMQIFSFLDISLCALGVIEDSLDLLRHLTPHTVYMLILHIMSHQYLLRRTLAAQLLT